MSKSESSKNHGGKLHIIVCYFALWSSLHSNTKHVRRNSHSTQPIIARHGQHTEVNIRKTTPENLQLVWRCSKCYRQQQWSTFHRDRQQRRATL